MAVKIRLKRMGAKKRSFYRVVTADSRSPRDGRFIETVGTYNPITNPAEVKLNEERILYWLTQGAIPTDTVKSLLSKAGIMTKFSLSKNPRPKKKATTPKAPAKKEVAPKTEAKTAKTEVKEPKTVTKKPVKKATPTKTTKKVGNK